MAPCWLHALHKQAYKIRRVKRWQVRAGEGESEASGTVLTNPVWKTSTYSGLSTRGRAQARFQPLLLCCIIAWGITRVS